MTFATRTTQDLQAADARHHLHSFTDPKLIAEQGSRIIVRGQGAHVWDNDGRKILDGMAGLWCVNVGYGRQELADAASRPRCSQLPYYNTSLPERRTPPDDRPGRDPRRAGARHRSTTSPTANSAVRKANDAVLRLGAPILGDFRASGTRSST
jgi:hypothetical protein